MVGRVTTLCMALFLCLSVACLLPRAAGGKGGSDPDWYPLDSESRSVLEDFLQGRLEPYAIRGINEGSVSKAAKLGACEECDPHEARWNSHFQIVNGTAYLVGGIPPFWNEHHRKRVKSTLSLLHQLTQLDPSLPDVEFVVNFHDYNKVLREAGATRAWGQGPNKPLFGNATNVMGVAEGNFTEHVPLWDGHDWTLYYRIHGNHFGNKHRADPPEVATFSATSCAFSYDISFPTTFYDFDCLDAEWDGLHEKTEREHVWEDKKESAYFRGSCWFYQKHGRTAAVTMSEVAPDMVDAAWYDDIRTDMLEKDGLPQFGAIEDAAAHKYLLHLEGHDYWSMRVRSLLHIRSLVLWQTLPCEEFYYGFFKAYMHYVPLRRDLGDLYEAILWARQNDEEVKRIADQMIARARSVMSSKMVLQYTHMLLQKYAKLLNYKVLLRKDFEKVADLVSSPCLKTVLPCVDGKPIDIGSLERRGL